MKMDKIKCAIIPVGEPAYEAEITPDLENLQKLVGGMVEMVPLSEGLVLICDEEGKINGKTGNRHIGNDIIAGQFIIAGSKNGDICSLPDKVIEILLSRFKIPDVISQSEVEKNLRIKVVVM